MTPEPYRRSRFARPAEHIQPVAEQTHTVPAIVRLSDTRHRTDDVFTRLNAAEPERGEAWSGIRYDFDYRRLCCNRGNSLSRNAKKPKSAAMWRKISTLLKIASCHEFGSD